MNKFFRALIAGWGAKKLGGGCLSTIVIFILIYVALGQCNETRATTKPGQRPAIEHNSTHQKSNDQYIK